MGNTLTDFSPLQATPWLCFFGVTFSSRTATSSISSTPLQASQLLILTLVSELSSGIAIRGNPGRSRLEQNF